MPARVGKLRGAQLYAEANVLGGNATREVVSAIDRKGYAPQARVVCSSTVTCTWRDKKEGGKPNDRWNVRLM
ncbi:hypothetical protein D3C86_2069690 [compost metagenome]